MLSSSNTLHVLGKPWAMPHFIKPPKVSRLPDIVTVARIGVRSCIHTFSPFFINSPTYCRSDLLDFKT